MPHAHGKKSMTLTINESVELKGKAFKQLAKKTFMAIWKELSSSQQQKIKDQNGPGLQAINEVLNQ